MDACLTLPHVGQLSRAWLVLAKSQMRRAKLEHSPKIFTNEEHAIVRMIRERVKRGESLDQISRTSGIYYERLHRLARAAEIRYKHRRPTDEQREEALKLVRDRGYSFRAAAALVNMSRTAIHRWLTKQRERNLASAGDLQPIDGNREFSRNKQTWTCPIHGKVTLWPCIACAAIAAKQSQASPRQDA